jgi:hypothetical protein
MIVRTQFFWLQIVFFVPFLMLNSYAVFANPFFDIRKVPQDDFDFVSRQVATTPVTRQDLIGNDSPVLRIDVSWSPADEKYSVIGVQREDSGTEYLAVKAKIRPKFGSFRAELIKDGVTSYHASVGIGPMFRRLNRGFSFRFPFPGEGLFPFRMFAENPISGQLIEVVNATIDTTDVVITPVLEAKINLLKAASASPKVLVPIYAEGYSGRNVGNGETRFLADANRVVDAFEKSNIPIYAHMEFYSVFAKSNQPLGQPQNLGLPAAARDSFLGLYFPYWVQFDRWYNTVYPTDFRKFRNSAAIVPYDYPIAVVDSDVYFGVGNYREITAVPSNSPSFNYLVIHEFGHYLGLNEEYDTGGTELAFAPNMAEPWSPNLTFHPQRQDLKWVEQVASNVPLPTSKTHWNPFNQGPVGAYPGGYGGLAQGRSYKPGLACVMDTGKGYCPVCQAAILREFHVEK